MRSGSAPMAKQAKSFHFLLNTIPNPHDVNPYLVLLKRDATMVMVGALTALEPPLQGSNLIIGRRRLAGSVIGGIPETQEMINFCAKHNIVSDVEVIPMQSVNQAYERLVKNDVSYCFVIDMASLR